MCSDGIWNATGGAYEGADDLDLAILEDEYECVHNVCNMCLVYGQACPFNSHDCVDCEDFEEDEENEA